MAIKFDKTVNKAFSKATEMAKEMIPETSISARRWKKLVPLSGYNKPLAKLTPAQQAVIDKHHATLRAALKELQLLENELANPNITDDIAEEVTQAIAKQKEIINTAQYSIRGAKKAFYGEQLMNATV